MHVRCQHALLWPWKDSLGKGIISEGQAWQGFANEGVLTVGALVMAKAVDSTGVVSIAMKKIWENPRRQGPASPATSGGDRERIHEQYADSGHADTSRGDLGA